jgi:nucleoside-diphosphate-sugar epimerase
MNNKIALVVGASGMTGINLAEKLLSNGWETYGLARTPNLEVKNLKPVTADLLDIESLKSALTTIKPTHVYITTWMRNDTEAENVYAAICKETGRPFIWPGSSAQWNGLSDVTDARILAEHLIWASTTDAARNEAFNVVNGDIFRWNWLWKRIAAYFGLEPVEFSGSIQSLEKEMLNDAEIWRDIALKYQLREKELSRLATSWHTDLDLGRPIEVVTDMSKSRKLGFTIFQNTEETFYDLFEQLRNASLIPSK